VKARWLVMNRVAATLAIMCTSACRAKAPIAGRGDFLSVGKLLPGGSGIVWDLHLRAAPSELEWTASLRSTTDPRRLDFAPVCRISIGLTDTQITGQPNCQGSDALIDTVRWTYDGTSDRWTVEYLGPMRTMPRILTRASRNQISSSARSDAAHVSREQKPNEPAVDAATRCAPFEADGRRLDALTWEMARLGLPPSTANNVDAVIYGGLTGGECVVLFHCSVDHSPTPRGVQSDYAGRSLLIREHCNAAMGCIANLVKVD
jgi:hypothetical protein